MQLIHLAYIVFCFAKESNRNKNRKSVKKFHTLLWDYTSRKFPTGALAIVRYVFPIMDWLGLIYWHLYVIGGVPEGI